MDRQLRADICNEVKASIAESMEVYKERWVSAETLRQHCEIFTKAWMKHYGKYLPRTQAIVTLQNGEQKATKWVYPLHKILAMLENGKIKQLISYQ